MVINNNVKNDVCLKISFSIPVNIKQPKIIPKITIPPKNRPDKNIPPGTFINLKSNVAKSPTDRIPNMVFNLRSCVIIGANVPPLGEVANFATVYFPQR